MLSNVRIGTICYYVNDIDRTEAFYRDVAGLNVQRMEGDEETGDWLLASTENNIELIFFKMESRPGNTPIVVFDLSEGGIDNVVEGLAEKGATIVTPVSHAPGGWSAEFADPDGHVLSVYQSEERPRRSA
ncbi:VOC family protein [Nitratireductor aquimarinus]|uniref:VOC family protein n=1 Tax=Nitratireductor TaxID=245876 RepID=UPI000DDF1613|nr:MULTISPECIES: VOC family protein [Nitratireductor]MBN7762040.1 VOC family protein [Nitratireductor aquibiodomus]MBN7775304.1 VOC family protein [Nitratireductor pacificus]MBN7781318.1 VOC family protein [Nitratireductor pacificus]MBN7790124.1 VOC family protein [Nitratireductor aquimarinus]MBN8243914.1 VOC family protein [Nitratireductor aquimarinus]